METVRFNRCSEAQFRTLVPTKVNNCLVLEVIGFQSGGSGCYASAWALAQMSDAPKYATYMLVCQDDNPIGELKWHFYHGNYGFTSRRDAGRDLVKRAYPSLIDQEV